MKLRLSTLLHYRVNGVDGCDGLAVADGEAGTRAALRWFLAGELPCGECALCRRTLVGACRARRVVLPGPPPDAVLDVPDRFLTPVDEPRELAALDDGAAVSAGLVAWGLQALAIANVAGGDLAIWLGDGPLPVAGAQLAAARGARAFLLAPGDAGAEPPGVTRVETAEALASAVLAAEAGRESAEGHAAMRGQRRLLAASTDAATLSVIAALAGPGSTTVLMGAGPAALPAGFALAPEATVARSAGYHPDLIPEALAALRRGELQLPLPGTRL
jgi:threonine dehydrogenase-like Zn-dependent dehydrogenase